MKTKKQIRIVISVVLFIIMVSMGIFLFINADDVFTTSYRIKYVDGCEEIYKNDTLVTEECVMGRLLQRKKKTRNGLNTKKQ